MPPVVGVVAGAIAVELGAGTVLAGLIQFGATAAATYGLNELLSSEDDDKPSSRPLPVITTRPEILKQPIPSERYVYGSPVVGGVFCFIGVSNINAAVLPNVEKRNQAGPYLVHQIVLASHECDGLEWARIDGVDISPDAAGFTTAPDLMLGGRPFVRMSVRLGAARQEADPILLENFPSLGNDFRQLGHTVITPEYYFGASVEEHREIWGEVDRMFQAKVRGAKVFDPREPGQLPDHPVTWKWSRNAALVSAAILTNPRITRGVSYRNVDMEALIRAANVCDNGYGTIEGGVEPAYTIDAAFDSSERPMDILDECMRSMNGVLILSEGKYKIIAGDYEDPVAAIGKQDMFGSATMMNNLPSGERIDRLSVRCRVPAANDQVQALPLVSLVPMVQQFGVNEASVTLRFVEGVTRGQRIGFNILQRRSLGMNQTITVGRRLGLALEPNDKILMDVDRPGQAAFNGLYGVQSIRARSSSLFDLNIRQYSNEILNFDPAKHAKPFDVRTIQ